MEFIDRALKDVEFPRIVKIRQNFDPFYIKDVPAAVRAGVEKLSGYAAIQPGQRIAITGTSRGVDRMPEVLRTVVELVKAKGAEPFIIPAMGSHGGATAEGQRNMLAGLGVTEETMGVPILATMDVELIAHISDGRPVYVDKYAHEADGIILVNRIKNHTGFRGDYESGLMKMMAIGLGKQRGAKNYHSTGFKYMGKTIAEVGNTVLKKEKILFGVGVIENSHGKLSDIACLEPNEIPVVEKELLKLAHSYLPRPFFDKADVLVVQEIGKDVSGTGMDSNVIGRYNNEYVSSPEISYTRIVVLDLSEHTNGNGNGMGFADYTTRRFFNKLSLEQTYPNVITSAHSMTVRIPMIIDTDKLAIAAALQACLVQEGEKPKVGFILNTKDLDTIYISESLLDEARACPHVEVVGEPFDIPFTENGELKLSFK
ncbi:DUF362 domain-containing protein [Oscillibacter sp. MSJ-2]|uniref:DUF362 domain-containing protein n=1 Tax=Dysosmobacter acutus TaxID=2841504 RepID=A0ABS6F930_9FIRM|nr:DUF362 domain-containing protein [Dysosmobacter acutus]MBU5626126.1 DUF362 domain-containing protein [Dysosmobacter acutus]